MQGAGRIDCCGREAASPLSAATRRKRTFDFGRGLADKGGSGLNYLSVEADIGQQWP